MKETTKGPYKLKAGPMASSDSNNTIFDIISSEYMHAIVGVYAVVILIVFSTVLVILFKKIQDAFCPRKTVGFILSHGAIGANRDELNQVLDIHEENISIPDDSTYDNISLDAGRTYYDALENSTEDVPPYYESPPSYVPQYMPQE